jgi:hypothetical protein
MSAPVPSYLPAPPLKAPIAQQLHIDRTYADFGQFLHGLIATGLRENTPLSAQFLVSELTSRPAPHRRREGV